MPAELTEVPWLVKADMRVEYRFYEADAYSLKTWLQLIDPEFEHGLHLAVHRECRKRDGHYDEMWQSENLHTRAENAQLWNRATRSLGFYKSNGYMVK